MIYPDSLQKLINCYKKLPGIGDKSAERMALATLDLSKNDIENYADALINSKENLKHHILSDLWFKNLVVFIMVYLHL